MIIYNETIIVDEAIHQQWLNWLQQTQIPQVMATGCFKSHQVLTIIDSPNEGVTYCVQYHADDIEDVQRYYEQHLQGFHTAMQANFENKCVMFNTVMKTVPPSPLKGDF